ncbi:InlB B-repeat-containing protein [Porphyromonas endodontalis]|uniref:InlB B-repeat-containing protein n=1 Tax=Porphyromonas endodontalis TaxID=28124 RepID=UPI003C78C801
MKRSNSKAKALSALLGATTLIIVATFALLFAGCNQAGTGGGNSGGNGGGDKPTPNHKITFSVDGANGTLKAKADGIDETDKSPISVEEGKTITFTATPSTNYRVKEWKVDDATIKDNTSNTYSHEVTKACTVKVSFEDASTPKKHEVTFSVEGENGGTLKAKADGVAETDKSPISVEENKTVTFTATPAKDYRVKGWKVGDTVVANNKTNAYTHTVTKPATITVSFEVPSVEGGAVLILKPDKHDLRLTAKTADGSAIAVEGCNETTLASGTYSATLTATGTKVILKGNIIELDFRGGYGYENPLTFLNVHGLTSLQKLTCNGLINLTSLNVQGLSSLKELQCFVNDIISLNVKDCASLEKLNCNNNKLTSLNLQGCTALKSLKCDGNKLTELNVHGLTTLQTLDCSKNELTSLIMQGCIALKELYYNDNNKLTTLDVQSCTSLEKLHCRNTKLTSLDVHGLIALQSLQCERNHLTALNVQGCTALENIYCEENQLTSLNVQGCTSLNKLRCSGNKFTELNVQGLKALQSLNCESNQLTTLNVQDCTALKYLYCYANKLNAEAFKKLFNDLPTREASDKAIAILYTEKADVTEGNHKDFTTPDPLKTAFENAKSVKHWELKKKDASGEWKEI